MRLNFGEYSVDLDERRLSRGTDPVHLSPKAFEALKLLIESRPAAMSKSELLERVWRGVFVSDASLTRTVNEIRAALGDTARDAQIIRTVHSYGYAFVADAREEALDRGSIVPSPTVAYLLSAARVVALRQGEQFVGRDPASDIRIDSAKVSWRHARIVADRSATTIEDLGSKNGTLVRGIRITSPTRLEQEDEVQIGRVKFVFRTGEVHQATETDAEPPGAS